MKNELTKQRFLAIVTQTRFFKNFRRNIWIGFVSWDIYKSKCQLHILGSCSSKQSTLSGFCKSVPIGDNLFINMALSTWNFQYFFRHVIIDLDTLRRNRDNQIFIFLICCSTWPLFFNVKFFNEFYKSFIMKTLRSNSELFGISISST